MPVLTGNDRVSISAVQVGLAALATVNIAHGLAQAPDHVEAHQVETSGAVGADAKLNVTADATNIIVFNSGTAISGQFVASAFIYTRSPIG